MFNESFLSVGEAAIAINVAPRAISNAIYDRKIDIERCPIVAGRRLIPRDYLAEIARILGTQKDDDATPSAAEPAGAA